MPVRIACSCGTSFELKDEFAGRLVKCPQCGREHRAPGTAVAAQPQADPVFDRDIFLLRQQLLKISEKYDVGDEKGNNIIYVERPAHLLQNLGAILAAIAAFAVVFIVFTSVADETPPDSSARAILVLLGTALSFIAAFAVGIPLSAKRHVTFYRDASKRERLIEVLQDKKWQPITNTYTDAIQGEGKQTVLILFNDGQLEGSGSGLWVGIPTKGRIIVNGTDITKLSRTRLAHWRAANIGYVFQTHNLVPVLTAAPALRGARARAEPGAAEESGNTDRRRRHARGHAGGAPRQRPHQPRLGPQRQHGHAERGGAAGRHVRVYPNSAVRPLCASRNPAAIGGETTEPVHRGRGCGIASCKKSCPRKESPACDFRQHLPGRSHSQPAFRWRAKRNRGSCFLSRIGRATSAMRRGGGAASSASLASGRSSRRCSPSPPRPATRAISTRSTSSRRSPRSGSGRRRGV